MGSFGIWIWLVWLIVLGITVGTGLGIWLLVRATKNPTAASMSTVSPSISTSSNASTEDRLKELASLLSKGLITDAEYEQQRSAVIRSV
jgi:hypothetical protein